MKKNITYIFLLFSSVSFLFSCAPLEEVITTPVSKTRTIDYYEREVTKTGIYQKPIVADLVVAKQKSTLTRTYDNISETEAKDYVSAEFAMNENCDVIVHPIYEVETNNSNGEIKINISITGYAAHYKNIRNFELRDTGAYRIFSYVNAVAEEKPKVASGNVTEVKETKVTKPAQPVKSTFGINAGVTSATYKSEDEKSDSKLGLTLGIFSNIGIGDKASFQPGLYFTQKGGKEEFGSNNTSSLTLNYLEIPLNFLFYTKSERSGFFFGGGPVVGVGLSGNQKVTFGGDTETADVNFGSDEAVDDLKRFELGFNFAAGLRSKKGLSLTLNYALGNNISFVDDFSFNNRYFGVRLGYEFGGK
jgi:hypothetical protein